MDNARNNLQMTEVEMSSEQFPVQRSRYDVGVAQTVGTRKNQEDSYAISAWKDQATVDRQGLLAAVADGIGGLNAGEVASNTLMRSFCSEFTKLDPAMSPAEKLLELTARGQKEVLEINRSENLRSGTTLVAVLIYEDMLNLISVGDSRIVLYRQGAILQLNREHIAGRDNDENRALYDREAPPLEERKKVRITSFIGKEGMRLVDRTLNPIRLLSGDRVLLMSDGVFGTLSDDELIALMNRAPQDAAEEAINLVEEKKKAHQDNATIVIIGIN